MNDVFFRTRWIGVRLALSVNRYLCLVLTHMSARSIKIGYTYVYQVKKIHCKTLEIQSLVSFNYWHYVRALQDDGSPFGLGTLSSARLPYVAP